MVGKKLLNIFIHMLSKKWKEREEFADSSYGGLLFLSGLFVENSVCH